MAGGFSTKRYEETSAELMAPRAAVVPTPGNLEALAHLLCVELCAEPGVTPPTWEDVVDQGCDKEWLDLAGKVYELLSTRAATKLDTMNTPTPGPDPWARQVGQRYRACRSWGHYGVSVGDVVRIVHNNGTFSHIIFNETKNQAVNGFFALIKEKWELP